MHCPIDCLNGAVDFCLRVGVLTYQRWRGCNNIPAAIACSYTIAFRRSFFSASGCTNAKNGIAASRRHSGWQDDAAGIRLEGGE